jgi:hypothetical protein
VGAATARRWVARRSLPGRGGRSPSGRWSGCRAVVAAGESVGQARLSGGVRERTVSLTVSKSRLGGGYFAGCVAAPSGHVPPGVTARPIAGNADTSKANGRICVHARSRRASQWGRALPIRWVLIRSSIVTSCGQWRRWPAVITVAGWRPVAVLRMARDPDIWTAAPQCGQRLQCGRLFVPVSGFFDTGFASRLETLETYARISAITLQDLEEARQMSHSQAGTGGTPATRAAPPEPTEERMPSSWPSYAIPPTTKREVLTVSGTVLSRTPPLSLSCDRWWAIE